MTQEAPREVYDCAVAVTLLGRGDMLGVITGELETGTKLFMFPPRQSGKK